MNGFDIHHYINEEGSAAKEGTLVIWEEFADSLRLALSAHGLPTNESESIIATLFDALDNNS